MGWFSDFFSNPTLDQSRMTPKSNGKRKGDWLQPVAESVSDWIPNEFSKTSNNWTGNIPYVGWVLRGLAGADNAAETYANSGNLMDAAQHGWRGFSGNAADPNMYSEKNQAGMFRSKDPWLSIGQGINLVPSSGGSSWMQYGNMANKGISALRNNGSMGSNGLPTGSGMMGFQMPSMGMGQMPNFGMGGQQKTNPRNQQKAQFNAMMMELIKQTMSGQNQQAQNQYREPVQSSYQPRIEFGNLYRPEVSGIGATPW